MNKLTALISAAMLFAGVLTACGEIPKDNPADMTPTEQPRPEMSTSADEAIPESITESVTQAAKTYDITKYPREEGVWYRSVVYGGNIYSGSGLIYSKDELDYYISVGEHIGEVLCNPESTEHTPASTSEPGEIADGEPFLLENDFDSTCLPVGMKLYLLSDYIVAEYPSPIVNNGEGSFGEVYYLPTGEDTTPRDYDITEYGRCLPGNVGVVYGGNLYCLTSDIHRKVELESYISQAEYIGKVESYVISDPFGPPQNELESNTLKEGTKLYLLGDYIVAEYAEPQTLDMYTTIYGDVLCLPVDELEWRPPVDEDGK